MIVTSSAKMGDTGEATGVWFEELSTPYFAFVDEGASVTIASITGGSAPIDPRSVKPKGENEASVDRFLDDAAASGALTAFSDSEERAAGLDEAVPFLLESRLRELGGRYENVADFQPFAIADGRLVTGQNPASSALTAKLTLQALNGGDA